MQRFKDGNYLFILLLSLVSLIHFYFKVHSAYVWPLIDMVPFFERMTDSGYNLFDFFTNASVAEPNPRWVSGYFVLFVSKVFNISWYEALYMLYIFLVLFLPVVLYTSLCKILKNYIEEDKIPVAKLLIFISILFVIIITDFRRMVSIAGWEPISMSPVAQNISFFFALLGIILAESKSRFYLLLSILSFASSIFLHPTFGFLVFVFYLISILFKVRYSIVKYAIIFVFSALIPLLTINLVFSPSQAIETKSFIDIYILERHPHHYHFLSFVSFSKGFLLYFITMSFLFLMPLFYFKNKKMDRLFVLSLALIVAYAISIISQYIFIDILPIKFFAMLSPVRFTAMGYWLTTLLWAIMLSNTISFQNLYIRASNLFPDRKIVPATAISFTIIILVYLAWINIDKPMEKIRQDNAELFDFIDTTDTNSTFATPILGNYSLNIAYIGKRAIFIHDAFPFTETFMIEFQKRRELLYGNISTLKRLYGSASQKTRAEYYRSLTPNDFYNISKIYPLDYVVVESEHSKAFCDYTPVYKQQDIYIYKVSNFVNNTLDILQ